MAKFQAKDVDNYLSKQYNKPTSDLSSAKAVSGRPAAAVQPAGELQSQQLQKQSQKDIEVINDIIAERDAELRAVFLEAKEVNQLFHQVADMVNDQGVVVDRIDNNIKHAGNDVKRAANEVKKAEEEDKSNPLPWVLGGVGVAGVVGAVVGAVFLL